MTIQIDEKKCRCRGCRAVLAVQTPQRLTIKRDGMVIDLDEAATLKVTCYWPRCRAENVISHPPRVGQPNQSSGPCR